MGRYSFFSINFVVGSYYVSADLRSSDVLSSTASSDSDTSSTSSSDTTSSIQSDIMGYGSQTIDTAEVSGELQEDEISEGKINSFFHHGSSAVGDEYQFFNHIQRLDIMPLSYTSWGNYRRYKASGGLRFSSFNGVSEWLSNFVTDKYNKLLDDLLNNFAHVINRIDETNGRIDSLDVRSNSERSYLAKLIAALRTDATHSDRDINKRIDSLDVRSNSERSYLAKLIAALRTDATHSDGAINKRIDNLDVKLVSTQGIVSGLTDGLAKLRSDATHSDGAINKRIDNLDVKLVSTQGIVSGLSDALSNLRQDATFKDDDLQQQINGLGTWKNVQLAWNTAQEGEMVKLRSSIDNIYFDDSGIINAINNQNKAWYSDDYWTPTILSGDGGIVKIAKSMLQHANKNWSDLFKQLTEQFKTQNKNFSDMWIWWKVQFDYANKDSVFYRIRYSIIEESHLIQDLLLDLYKGQNVMSDILLTTNDWLKKIADEPISDVNIVNEAGTNLFDVLDTIVEAIGKLLETGLKEIGDTLRDVLKFLDGLIEELLRLIVPENLDFLDEGFDKIKGKFDVKFGSFISLGGQVKDIFNPIPGDFFQAVSFNFMGVDFKPDKSMTDGFVPKFRTAMAVYVWILVAIYCYKKFTGQGDMINDN